MEFTAKGIPTSLRPFFQEYSLEKLDPDEDAFTVIERALEWGNHSELRWLFSRYGPGQLAAWVREAGWRCLSRRSLHLWAAYFDLHDLPQRRNLWPY